MRYAVCALMAAICCAQPGSDSLPLSLEGKAVDPFAARAKATIFVFVRSDCPISNRYAPELRRIHEQFQKAEANFCLEYADRAETADSIGKHTRDYNFGWLVLRDPDMALVKRARVTVTPEAAVFDFAGRLVYHGRIDDRFADFGKVRPTPTVHDLEDAIVATLASRRVASPSTKAIGCFLADLK